jgi:hypothetical protein
MSGMADIDPETLMLPKEVTKFSAVRIVIGTKAGPFSAVPITAAGMPVGTSLRSPTNPKSLASNPAPSMSRFAMNTILYAT